MPATGNVGVAFALVLGSGMSTALGAALVFYRKTSPLLLAAGLGIAAGVMLYVSMVEIFMIKGVGALIDGGWGEDGGYRNGTMLLFTGMVMTYLLDIAANSIADFAIDSSSIDSGEVAQGDPKKPQGSSDTTDKKNVPIPKAETKSVHSQVTPRPSMPRLRVVAGLMPEPGTRGTRPTPEPWMIESFRRPSLPRVWRPQDAHMSDMEALMHKKAAREEHMQASQGSGHAPAAERHGGPSTETAEHHVNVNLPLPPTIDPPEAVAGDPADRVNAILTDGQLQMQLQKMGFITALSIAIHNLPEGLATFVAALHDPLNAAPIAFAIAMHNIPEGICVAIPIFYATGSRWKGFLWALASGFSELLGGLLGYSVLYGNRMSDVAYGVLFCLVGGMMVYIALMELIPTALKFDTENLVTSRSVVVGMAVMAASLLVFTTSGIS